jgi:hypothetical protein
MGRERTLDAFPQLTPNGLKAGIVYYDGKVLVIGAGLLLDLQPHHLSLECFQQASMMTRP